MRLRYLGPLAAILALGIAAIGALLWFKPNQGSSLSISPDFRIEETWAHCDEPREGDYAPPCELNAILYNRGGAGSVGVSISMVARLPGTNPSRLTSTCDAVTPRTMTGDVVEVSCRPTIQDTQVFVGLPTTDATLVHYS
jgi:hypothetical protein